MNPLAEILQQIPDLEIVTVDEDFMKTEIQFRVDSNWWVSKLEPLTRTFRDIYFTKRYITENDRFGFRWSILKLGQMEEEMWKELAEKFSFLLFDLQAPIKQPQKATKREVQTKSSSRDNRKVISRPVYDEDNTKQVGEITDFPIPHVFNEMNKPIKGRGGAVKLGEKPLEALYELYPRIGSGPTG